MGKIVIAHIPSDSTEIMFRNNGKSTRGARVYGLPMTPELASFIEDVAPENAQQRLINMFFAGRFSPFDEEEGNR